MPPPLQNPSSAPPLCMDARMLATAGGTGVSSYARQMQRAFTVLRSQHGLLTDRARFDAPPPAPFGRAGRWLRALAPGVRHARAIASDGGAETLLFAPDVFRIAQIYFDIYRRPLEVRLPGPPGIMHWTYPVPLTIAGWHNVYTVHDVIPLLHPRLTHIDGRRYRRLLDRLGEGASRFIAVSETARLEIVRTLGCAPSFVIDCGLAVDASPPDAEDLPPTLAPGGFLLICGTVEIRKNVAAALAAYRLSAVDMPLVIAGPDGWGAEAVAREILDTPGVIRLPYLDLATMRALIGHARALLMPSLAEGFGLPVAEAMALGTPVVASDRGALAETAGGAARAVDPADVPAMASAIRSLALDDAACAALTAAGLRNAERFRPERFAERLTWAYAAVMAGPA